MSDDPKNPLSGVISEAFSFIRGHLTRYGVFLLIALLLYVIVDVVTGHGLIPSPDKAQDFSSLNAAYFLTPFASAVFAVPLHNFIINRAERYVSPHWDRVVRFAVLELIVSIPALLFIYGLPKAAPFIPAALLITGGIVFVIFYIFLSAVMTPVFPYIAVTPSSRLDLRYAISISNSHRFSVFGKMFYVGIAIMFINLTVEFLILTPINKMLDPNQNGIGRYLSDTYGYISLTASALIFITLASFIFIRLTRDGDSVVSGATYSLEDGR